MNEQKIFYVHKLKKKKTTNKWVVGSLSMNTSWRCCSFRIYLNILVILNCLSVPIECHRKIIAMEHDHSVDCVWVNVTGDSSYCKDSAFGLKHLNRTFWKALLQFYEFIMLFDCRVQICTHYCVQYLQYRRSFCYLQSYRYFGDDDALDSIGM